MSIEEGLKNKGKSDANKRVVRLRLRQIVPFIWSSLNGLMDNTGRA
jgi:hypothetical protein